MCSYLRVILHLSAKFRRYRTIGGGVITSYRLFKMAAIQSQIENVLPVSGSVTASD